MTGNVFIISKPIVPPWNDSGKNIAKDLVTHGERYSYRVLTTKDFRFEHMPQITYERVYPSGGTFQAGLKQNVKVMFAGLNKRGASIYHYFFAPNTLSAAAGKIQRAVTRVKTVQTFCSRPLHYNEIQKLVFTDKIIVLSKHTREQLLNAGISPQRVVHIPPGISTPAAVTNEERQQIRKKYHLENRRVVLFPGDYEFSDTASRVTAAANRITDLDNNILLLFACRAKTDASREKKRMVERQLKPLGDRVAFLDEITDMPRLVGAVDLVLLPQENLYAKMDIPLVLIEAMAHGVPLVVANDGPLCELISQRAGLGTAADADDLAHNVARILRDENLARQLGENGKNLANTRYSANSMAKEIENLYDELLEK